MLHPHRRRDPERSQRQHGRAGNRLLPGPVVRGAQVPANPVDQFDQGRVSIVTMGQPTNYTAEGGGNIKTEGPYAPTSPRGNLYTECLVLTGAGGRTLLSTSKMRKAKWSSSSSRPPVGLKVIIFYISRRRAYRHWKAESKDGAGAAIRAGGRQAGARPRGLKD